MMEKLLVIVACHGGPAEHFVKFSQELVKDGYQIQICASGAAISVFDRNKLPLTYSFAIDSENNRSIAKENLLNICSKAEWVITDVGHAFDIDIQRMLSDKLPSITTIAYVDNPEAYVPGGYTDIAIKVCQIAKKVLFANALLTHEPSLPIAPEKRFPLGFYPSEQVERLLEARKHLQKPERARFLASAGIPDTGQKIITLFGGGESNTEYLDEVFPHFLRCMDSLSEKDLSSFLFVLQQHPGVKLSHNRDKLLVEKWNLTHSPYAILVSNEPSDTMQIITDCVMYHQTSLSVKLALAGVPMIQIGVKPYQDIALKNKLCFSAIDPSTLKQALHDSCLPRHKDPARVREQLGIRDDWLTQLKNILQ